MKTRRFSLTRQVVAALALVPAIGSISLGVQAQTIDTGYAIVSELTGGAKGSEVFQSPWGVPDLVAIVSGSSVTLQPNFNTYADNPGDAFWRDNGGAGPGGNKWMDMSAFSETPIPASGSESMETFTGCAVNSLASPYTSIAFIKVFAADFSALFGEVTAPASGTFDLSIAVAGDVDVVVQKGFTTSGPNANPDDAAALGSVDVTIGAPCAAPAPPPASGPSTGGQPIPVLPVWALFLLAGVLGLFGAKAASRRMR